MKNNTYIITLESGCYEWTRENEIHGLKEAKEAGVKEAQRCGKDIFYLVRCSQWWPNVTMWTRNLLEEIEEESDCIINDNQVMRNVSESELRELHDGVKKLIRQWLIRNKRIPNGVHFEEEIIYKVKDGKAVRIGKSE